MLEWIIGNKSTGDDDEDDEIEAVSAKALWTLVESVDHLAVLFCECTVPLFVVSFDRASPSDSHMLFISLGLLTNVTASQGMQQKKHEWVGVVTVL